MEYRGVETLLEGMIRIRRIRDPEYSDSWKYYLTISAPNQDIYTEQYFSLYGKQVQDFLVRTGTVAFEMAGVKIMKQLKDLLK